MIWWIRIRTPCGIEFAFWRGKSWNRTTRSSACGRRWPTSCVVSIRWKLPEVSFKVILSMMEGLKDCNDWDSFAGHFGYAGTPGAKKEVTGRGRSGSAAAAAAVAAVAGTGGSPAGTGPSAALGRRSTVHQSATSLIVGDGNSTSSNGGSPVASPSPQQNQHHLIIGKRFMAVVGRFFVSFGLRLDCC